MAVQTSRYFRNLDGTVLMLSGENVEPSAPKVDGIEEITAAEFDASMAAYQAARQKAVDDAFAARQAAAKSAYSVLSLLPGIGPETAKYLTRYTP
ncbi:hypothetical protein ABTX60_07370 [Streptomyces sp. NPDC126510]|uniref:hypothetical protein n=1 Tax=Streptomyces sp. NPDC126510 TaxID=3155317 RepID=UPI00332837C3